MFHIPKGKAWQFPWNTYDDAKLWNKFFHTFLLKETDLTKSKLKLLCNLKFLKNTRSVRITSIS